jgi:hypothetical protein
MRKFSVLVILLVLFMGCKDDPEDTPVDCTVIFDLDGGNISGDTTSVTTTVKSGETVTLPSPQKVDHAYTGWFTGKNGSGTQLLSTTKVTSDMTVYAKWDYLGAKSLTITGFNDFARGLSHYNYDNYYCFISLLTDNNSFTPTVHGGGFKKVESATLTVDLWLPPDTETVTRWTGDGDYYLWIRMNDTQNQYHATLITREKINIQKSVNTTISCGDCYWLNHNP